MGELEKCNNDNYDAHRLYKARMKVMKHSFIMDILFDLLNESNLLNVQELEEKEAAGVFVFTTQDGTRVQLQCTVLSQDPNAL